MKVRRYIRGDRIIWIVVLILLVISLLSVYSSTGSLAYQHRAGNTFFYLFRQLKFILLGLVVSIAFALMLNEIRSRRASHIESRLVGSFELGFSDQAKKNGDPEGSPHRCESR